MGPPFEDGGGSNTSQRSQTPTMGASMGPPFENGGEAPEPRSVNAR